MSLYPKINLPTLAVNINQSSAEKISPKFDFETGDFLISKAGAPVDATPRETYVQWCLKVCMTERLTRLAYSDKIGVELSDLPQKTHGAAKSQIIKTITEALMVHPKTIAVRNFSFKIEADSVWVTFTVKSRYGEDELTVRS